MSDFARKRQLARIVVGGLAVGLIALLLIESQAVQIGLTVFVVLCLLVQRAIWRCPKCGIPPSALPWGAPAECRYCQQSLR
ncbi:MAG: hypothetical protein MK209_08245 [Planctomycetes bacterium]|nr:hypothetical protein [Planctomycetota bacterium]